MNNAEKVLLLGIIGGLYYLYQQQQQSGGGSGCFVCCLEFEACELGVEVTAAVQGWKNAGEGPTWVPILNAAEQQYGLPQDMLAALAFQESSFIQKVIDGTRASSAGALGMMQLEPEYYPSVQVPRPFTTDDTQQQITDAANTLVTDYNALGSWPLAIAAYNAGLGAVQSAGGIPNNGQTPAYVAGILANAPAANV